MKKFNVIIIFAVMLCLLFSSFNVLAEPTEDDTQSQVEVTEAEPVTEPATEPETEPATTEEDIFVPSDYDTTEAEHTEEEDEPTQSTTRKPVPSTTRKPVPSTTRKQNTTTTRKPVVDNNDEDDRNNNDNQNEDKPVQTPVVITEDEDDLPEGSFYVYLERNNGTRRLKAILTKPELVSEPEIPVREGFIFEGWYADPGFKKKWDFFTDMAQDGTVIYAKWVPDPNAVIYKITIKSVEGGIIEVNPAEASVGEPVLITVKPDEGMRLVVGSVTINGKATDILNFSMPAENVVIDARFEVVPESEKKPEEKKSVLPFVLGGIVVLVAVGVVVFLVIRRRDDFAEDEIDENGTIIDDDMDMSWIDESIVVEDGFKDGEKVVGNFISESDDAFEIEDDE